MFRTGTPDAGEHQESFKTIKEGVDSARHVVAVPFQRSLRVLPRKPEHNHLSDAPRLVPVYLSKIFPKAYSTRVQRALPGASHRRQGHHIAVRSITLQSGSLDLLDRVLLP